MSPPRSRNGFEPTCCRRRKLRQRRRRPSSRSRVRRSKPDSAPLDETACTRAALTLLARHEPSRRELTRKLAAGGFPANVVARALAALERSGALREARFTESFVRSRVARGQGPQRIRAELAQRGIADTEIDDALREADIDWL